MRVRLDRVVPPSTSMLLIDSTTLTRTLRTCYLVGSFNAMTVSMTWTMLEIMKQTLSVMVVMLSAPLG